MDASEKHNRLAREFVEKAGRETESPEQLMVVVETMLLASMHLLTKVYDVPASHSSVYMEAALQAATERFAKGGK